MKWVAIGVLALAAAACGDSSSVTASSSTSSTTTSPPPTTTTSPTTTTLPSPPDNGAPASVPDLIVANRDGAFLVSPQFLAQLVTGPVELAIDDGAGGLVFQRSSFSSDPRDTIVSFLPADATQPQDLLVPTGEQFLELWDVATGAVWYTRSEGDSPETATTTLRAFDLAARQVEEISIVGGWESGVADVSVGSERIVTFWYAEASSGFDLLNLGGAVVSAAGDPYGGTSACNDGTLYDFERNIDLGTRCFSWPALSDVGTLAYVEEFFEGSRWTFTLTVVDLEDGTELLILDLERPDQGWLPRSLQLTEGHVLVNRFETADSRFIEALVIDLTTGGVVEAGVVGRARFLTGPMAISS